MPEQGHNGQVQRSDAGTPGRTRDAEFDSRAFRFLQEIASDLSGDGISFPTFIDATVKIRQALNDPDVDAERVARVVSGEPVLAAKLVRMANSVALNPSGKRVADVKNAVMRIGLKSVKATAVAVAMQQVRDSKDLAPFAAKAEQVWRHSLDVAAIAYVLARAQTSISPDEALFAGLVHDIGRFYLMSRATKYPELADHHDEVQTIIDDWHPAIGQAIVQALELSEAVVAAVADHEISTYRLPPKSLVDLVTLANLAAHARDGTRDTPLLPADSPVLAILDKSSDEIRSLIEAMS
jgi:putative nucleotidyltransferase with HDIG domain